MTNNRNNIISCLNNFELKTLFLEELGWDYPKQEPFNISLNDHSYLLTNIAEKRGAQVYVCSNNDDSIFPDNTTRRKVEVVIRKIAHEHLIIFIDNSKSLQYWQWVYRQKDQPAQYREHKIERGQGSESLLQKLAEIEININDEEGLRLLDVARRATRRF